MDPNTILWTLFLNQIICSLLLLPPAHVVDALVCSPPPLSPPAPARVHGNRKDNRGHRLLFNYRVLLIVDGKHNIESPPDSVKFPLYLSIKLWNWEVVCPDWTAFPLLFSNTVHSTHYIHLIILYILFRPVITTAITLQAAQMQLAGTTAHKANWSNW